MLIVWALLMLSSASCIKVTETTEETGNVTTLYPITKNDTSRNSSQDKTNSDSMKTGTKLTEILNNDERDSNKTESKEEPVIEKPGNSSKEFKPSVHLGNFFDEDSFGIVPLPTRPSSDPFSPLKKPPAAFFGSQKDEFPTHHPKTYERFPYKFEDAILTRAKSKWRPPGPESRPTSAVPVRVPAGGLYKGPFRDTPAVGAEDEEFGLEFNDDHANFVKKRENPWKGLVHFLTALIPVGLIISALTPNIITVHDTGAPPGYSGVNDPLPPRLFRRSAAAAASAQSLPPPRLPLPPPPAVSEPCRRRLLCELHSDSNYHDQRGSRRGRACHKLRCEEPAALAHALRWLLERRPPERNQL